MPRPSAALSMMSSTFAAVLRVAACGGGKGAGPAGPGGGVAAPMAQGDQRTGAGEGAGEPYGGVAYGGIAYGGAAYGGDPCSGIGQAWQDPCAGPMIAEPPPPPPDPPELAAYLPPSGPRPSGQLDPAAHYAVPLHDSPAAGPAAAPVTLVTTYEFADPYGDRLRPTLDALAARYGKDLRIVWKHFIVHRDRAQVAALGACAAAKQGKFQPFMNAMFEASVAPGGNRRWDLEAVKLVADGQGLDPAKFDKDLRGTTCKAEVIRDQQLFESLGQLAVPVSWINGRVVQGAQPAEAFAAVIDEELAVAKAALAKRGAKLDKYYAGLVKTGKTSP